MKHFFFIFLLSHSLTFGSLDELWDKTRIIYTQINESLRQHSLIETDIKNCHKEWLNFRTQIQDYVMGPTQKDFLNENLFHITMLRMGITNIQKYETSFLNNSVSKRTLNLLHRFKESDILTIPKECTEFSCTANSLGQMFYVARVFETLEDPETVQTIVEFGGGFGNLAHVFCSILPKTTYVIFDVPEMLALQHIYLKGSMPDRTINVIINPDQAIEPGSINLIPSAFCQNINLSTDLFISTFALSETSEFMQECIIRKRFYDAQMCYITGQIYQKTDALWAHHNIIQNSVLQSFKNYICQGFHAPAEKDRTYEIIATKA